MQGTRMGSPTPYRSHQRALHFNLLFGASGGVAGSSLLGSALPFPSPGAALRARQCVADRGAAPGVDRDAATDRGETLTHHARSES